MHLLLTCTLVQVILWTFLGDAGRDSPTMVVYSFYIFDRHGKMSNFTLASTLLTHSSRMHLQKTLADNLDPIFRQDSKTNFAGLRRRRNSGTLCPERRGRCEAHIWGGVLSSKHGAEAGR